MAPGQTSTPILRSSLNTTPSHHTAPGKLESSQNGTADANRDGNNLDHVNLSSPPPPAAISPSVFKTADFYWNQPLFNSTSPSYFFDSIAPFPILFCTPTSNFKIELNWLISPATLPTMKFCTYCTTTRLTHFETWCLHFGGVQIHSPFFQYLRIHLSCSRQEMKAFRFLQHYFSHIALTDHYFFRHTILVAPIPRPVPTFPQYPFHDNAHGAKLYEIMMLKTRKKWAWCQTR